MEKEKLEELLGKDLIHGYVYGYDGGRKGYYFENTPSNIANFIMLHKENADKMILTDMVDRLVLNTFGEFIDRCPDQERLQKVLNDLVPMQLAYCRVSSDSREQKNSFSVQVAYYTELIEKNEDWQYGGIYADEARSGTKLQKRDDFLRMMKDCEDGKIDMIITKSVTRFARNTVDSIQAIRRI